MIQYTNRLAIENIEALIHIQKILKSENNGNWHVVYAGLDVLGKVLQYGVTDDLKEKALFGSEHEVGIINFVHYGKINFGDDWRIREKVVEICFLNKDHQNIRVKQQLVDSLMKMKIVEQNKNVRKTLANP